MTENKRSMPSVWQDPDDAPDLSVEPWRSKLQTAPVRRGRPRAESVKVQTTLRLDRDVIAGFKAGGAGWQSRMNAALREWLARSGRST